MAFSIPDLIITIAYFSIPLQIVVSLCKFPRLTRRATSRVVILLILFALFIFLCGAGHLLRCLDRADTNLFRITNILTSVVSLVTSIYLLPFVPHLLEGADKLYLEATTSKQIIESMYPPNIRERLLASQRDEAVRRQSNVTEVDKSDKSDQSDKEGKENTMPKRLIHGNILHRMSRSDSMAVRRIHDFVNRKLGSNFGNTDLMEEDNAQQLDTVSEPIADNFPDTSIMFADLCAFTKWCSYHTPNQVFILLEALFFEFDQIAEEMSVFKLSTVGDCYIAVTGVPYPREDHPIVLAQFAAQCRKKTIEVMEKLSNQPDMDDVRQLKIRIGIHSGCVTAGVLRGNKARFDLFGDTINTAQRIESTGEPNMIHLSRETAELLERAGKGDWLIPRERSVSAKGKGELKTFWLNAIDIIDEGEGQTVLTTNHDTSGLAPPIKDIELTEQRHLNGQDCSHVLKRRISEESEGSSGSLRRASSDIV